MCLWNKSDLLWHERSNTTEMVLFIRVILKLCDYIHHFKLVYVSQIWDKFIKTVGFGKSNRWRGVYTHCCMLCSWWRFLPETYIDAAHGETSGKKNRGRAWTIGGTCMGEMWRMWCDSQALCRDEYNEEENLWCWPFSPTLHELKSLISHWS